MRRSFLRTLRESLRVEGFSTCRATDAEERGACSAPRGLGGHHGFTLLELLVVIAIIGLLAGYVAPRYFAQIGKSEVASRRHSSTRWKRRWTNTGSTRGDIHRRSRVWPRLRSGQRTNRNGTARISRRVFRTIPGIVLIPISSRATRENTIFSPSEKTGRQAGPAKPLT